MKKLVALLLTVSFILSLSACAKGGNSSEEAKVKHSVNVAKLAGSGQIPEVEFLIGDSVEGVKNELFKIAAGMTYEEFCDSVIQSGNELKGDMYAGFVSTTETEGYTVLNANHADYSTLYCIYPTDRENPQISAIAVAGDAYDFSGSTMKSYVKAAVKGEAKEEKPKSNFYFVPKEEEGASVLTYEFGVYKLEFYFSSYDQLILTLLYNTELH